MLGTGIVTLEFEEPDLATRAPGCVEFVSVALMLGFRLVGGGAVNHEDVLLGCERLQEFKDARARQLRRVVKWHFLSGVRQVEGQPMTVVEFLRQWEEDAALRREMRARGKYNEWFYGVQKLLSRDRRVAQAVEGSRTSYGKLHGAPETLGAMARFHEEGF
jgi:hypothetical protein